MWHLDVVMVVVDVVVVVDGSVVEVVVGLLVQRHFFSLFFWSSAQGWQQLS